MPDAVADLQRLGFSEYEARCFAALVQHSPANGYEVAKQSGVPRANVYAALQRLEERGAAVRVADAGGLRYAAVPPEELVRRLREQHDSALAAAERTLAALAEPAERAYLWNIRGDAGLLVHGRTLAASARRSLTVALWGQEAAPLGAALAAAEERGVAVRTLCLEGCPRPCPCCHGAVYRYRLGPPPPRRWLLLIADDDEALIGETGGEGEALAVRTRQPLLVALAGWYIRHSIALAGIAHDLGPAAAPLLTPETRAALAALAPGGVEGWPSCLRPLLAPLAESA